MELAANFPHAVSPWPTVVVTVDEYWPHNLRFGLDMPGREVFAREVFLHVLGAMVHEKNLPNFSGGPLVV